MRFTEISIDTRTPISSFLEIADDFCTLAMMELDMEELPKITFGLGEGLTNTFGFYDLDGEIFVETLNRHPMDILRTLAHELTHHRQNVRGELHAESGRDGSEHENEANAMAGVMLRKFAKARPDMFGLGPVGPDSILFEKVIDMQARNGEPYQMLQNPSQGEFDRLQRRHGYFRGSILPNGDLLIWPSWHEIHAEMVRLWGHKLHDTISLEGETSQGMWDIRIVQVHDCPEELLLNNHHLQHIRHTLPWPFNDSREKLMEVVRELESEDLNDHIDQI
jgi:hypothetical protein